MAGRSISWVFGHSYDRIKNAATDVDWAKLGKDTMNITVLVTGKGLENTFHYVEALVKDSDWAELGRNASQTVKSNPKTMLIPIGIVGGAVTGGLLMGPVLGVVSFSTIGPVAGKRNLFHLNTHKLMRDE